MEFITREAAIAAGLKRYFTGVPCNQGHICERHVCQSRCVECRRLCNVANYTKNPELQRQIAAEYRAKNHDVWRAQQAEYRAKNREVLRQRTANWRKQNPDKWRETDARYKAKPEAQEKIAKARLARERRLLATHPMFALKKRVRCLVKDAIKRGGHKKGEKTEVLLGCDWQFFQDHIEKQFLPGMTWDNRNLWHIDHVVPMSTAKTEAEVLALNHFTNLRPIWGTDNIRKGAKQTHLL